ncbi:O-sialoglycoprotein endopeptidase [Alkalithermobacter paradoxus]|uniref:N(6)-L-threonylcarbamoyladenine synthase n=1 Tax=Alkalithermobacter paradoxus TaxID=29349 RepID=A0A1V4IAI4_9FIRM|nr:tRNA N6-adenosine threonylcarbamoyltransferase [[Clostridium] thermoalcaliphilum]
MKSKNRIVLGVDTSCYTTSIAAVSLDKEILVSQKIQLKVQQGNKGLRQSDAVYQHVNNLGEIFSILRAYREEYEIKAICVSTKPRPLESSYMPVFNAGYKFAKAISDIMDIPLYESTHQEGHIEAGYIDTNMNENKFICVHISGGTTEILLAKRENAKYNLEIIGESKDISAGQLIDRVGVKLGYPFPAGKYIDENAINFKENINDIKISSSEGYINFSGVETKIYDIIKEYPKEYICKLTLECINKSLLKSLIYLCNKHYVNKVLFVGGVSSSRYISSVLKDSLNKHNISSYWTRPEYATDNAVGVALIGAQSILCGVE